MISSINIERGVGEKSRKTKVNRTFGTIGHLTTLIRYNISTVVQNVKRTMRFFETTGMSDDKGK